MSSADLFGSAQPRVANPKLPPPSYGDAKTVQPTKIRAWMDSGIQYLHPYRMRQHVTWRMADLYDESKQWLRPSYNSDPTRFMNWSRIEFDESEEKFPTPVYNEFSAPIENEAARLARPEYKPYVRPEGKNPDLKLKTAAELAKQALNSALDTMRWDEERDRGFLHSPLYGGWFVKSYWDASYEDTVKVGVEGAVSCPECGNMFASAEIGAEDALQLPPDVVAREELPDQTGAASKYTLTGCPTCTDHAGEEFGPTLGEDGQPQVHPETGVPLMGMNPARIPGAPVLQPHVPVDDELSQNDQFGRPLGQDVPIGNWRLETIPSYDVFVANLGIGVKTNAIDEFWLAHVETLGWLQNRYVNGFQVKPESPEALMRFHPIAGERALYYGSGGTGGTRLFNHHARVKEYCRMPWMEVPKDSDGNPIEGEKPKMNRGRYIVYANNVVLFDGDMLLDSTTNPGKTVPRVRLEYAPWKLRSGGLELYGVGMSEMLFDVQDNINEMHSQIQDCRQRKGQPKWLVTRGMNLDYEHGSEAGSQWEYDPDPNFPDHVPRDIDNTLINPGIYTEMEQDLAYIGRAPAMNEVETGNVPPGVTAALAMQILAEQSGERRRQRIRRIRKMFERLYSHGLLLMHELVREPRMMWEKDDSSGEWRQKSWTGLDLYGQCSVHIDAEPDHDTAVVEEQKIRDAVTMNPALLQNPAAARHIAVKLGVPPDLWEDQTLQEENAEREFVYLKDDGRQPVVDDDLDDHEAHYQQHGIDTHSDWFRDLENRAQWDQALLRLGNWKQMFDDPGPADPMTGQPGLSIDAMQQMSQPSLELRIYHLWKGILATAQLLPPPADPKNPQMTPPQPTDQQQALDAVLRWRAHMAAHKRMEQGYQVAAASGAPQIAAPGETQAPGAAPSPQQPQPAM